MIDKELLAGCLECTSDIWDKKGSEMNMFNDLAASRVQPVFVRLLVAAAWILCSPLAGRGEEDSEDRFAEYLDARRLVAKSEGARLTAVGR